MPGKYADLKGFNIYKSRAILERGMTKYENDPDVKKIFKSAGLVEWDKKQLGSEDLFWNGICLFKRS